MQDNKVSIISPCYNVERYVSRFLDSILNQTHKNIEIILINDGSTDLTHEIITRYIPLFQSQNITLKYITQNNQGQSAAINSGLEIFTGDYMMWADTDDELVVDSIERKVTFLESHPQYGLVIGQTEIVDEETGAVIGIQQRVKPKEEDNLFLDLITGKNVYYSPGGYMVRSKMFRKAMGTPLKIESPREIGQNYQLLLPISYYFPVGYIDDIVYRYTLRKGSHSRTQHSWDQDLQIINIGQRVLHNIISKLEEGRYSGKEIETALVIQKDKNLLRIMQSHNRKDFIKDIKSDILRLGIEDTDLIKSIKLLDSSSYRLYLKARLIGSKILHLFKRVIK